MPTNIKLPEKKLQTDLGETNNNNSRLIKNVTFFGDSAIPEDDPIYKSVWDLSRLLATNGYKIVDGGGPGIMKAATDGAESVDGKTHAIYWQPQLASYFEGKNLANITDESSASSNYVMRTLGLIENGDVYVVVKGGTGTISEFGLVWCLAKLYYGCHKPVILYGDFWDDLIESFRKNMNIDEVELAVLYQAQTPEEVLKIIIEHEEKITHCSAKKMSDSESGFIIGGRGKNGVEKPQDDTKKAYEEHGSNYHSKHAGNLASQEQLDDFMNMINPPAKVLDIGTGPGFDAGYLSQKFSVVGIEKSKRFYEIAQYECPNVNVINNDFLNHDFANEKFKGIWARDSIHHIKEEDLDLAFKKVSDLLVEDGVFYIIVREGEGEINETERKEYGELNRFYHLFSAEELISRAKKVGLSLVKLDRTKRSHKWIIGVFKKD